jgi:hypothetical protein
MLNDDEWLSLAQVLVRATKTNVLKWSVLGPETPENALRDPTYRASVGELTEYRIWAKDNDGRVPFILAVLRAKDIFDQLELLDTYETGFFDIGDGSTSDWVNDIYAAAARSATNAPLIVSSLLEELNDLLPQTPGTETN